MGKLSSLQSLLDADLKEFYHRSRKGRVKRSLGRYRRDRVAMVLMKRDMRAKIDRLHKAKEDGLFPEITAK